MIIVGGSEVDHGEERAALRRSVSEKVKNAEARTSLRSSVSDCSFFLCFLSISETAVLPLICKMSEPNLRTEQFGVSSVTSVEKWIKNKFSFASDGPHPICAKSLNLRDVIGNFSDGKIEERTTLKKIKLESPPPEEARSALDV